MLENAVHNALKVRKVLIAFSAIDIYQKSSFRNSTEYKILGATTNSAPYRIDDNVE